MSDWARTYEDGPDFLEHRDGVAWVVAPLPRRWHRCKSQTRGFIGGVVIERCACGATRFDGPRGVWVHKNETRNMRKRSFSRG